MLTASIAVLRAMQASMDQASPDVVAGHSLGEYSALVAAGVLEFSEAVRIVNLRGKFMQEAVPEGEGSMAAVVKMDYPAVKQLCEDASQGEVLVPANFNSPQQIVISGHKPAVVRAITLAKERGGRAIELQVSAPFHCPLMLPAQERLAKELQQVTFKDATFPVVTNVQAEPETKGSRLRELLIEQVTASVRWTDSVMKMIDMGVTEFAEIGPGHTLTDLIRQVGKDVTLTNYETPESILDDWEVEEDKRTHKRTGKIVWNDGLEWDPEAPGAFGF